MVVLSIHLDRIPLLKPEGHAPICPHCQQPSGQVEQLDRLVTVPGDR